MRYAILIIVALGTAIPAWGLSPDGKCLLSSGKAGDKCLKKYLSSLEKCRKKADTACEEAVRADGSLDAILAEPAAAVGKGCSDENALPLGYLSLDDILAQIPAACGDWGEDLSNITFAADLSSLSPEALTCQKAVAPAVRTLVKKTVGEFGKKCYVKAFENQDCDRVKRDAQVAKARAKAAGKIAKKCRAEFDSLGLVGGSTAATVDERIDEFLGVVVNRSQNFALRVYPPNDLGATADFGPHAIGVTTLALEDGSRQNVNDTGPRPVTVEVYYPSTAAAVDGVPRDVVSVLGIPIVATPAFRDVSLLPGTFPLVLFSHGNEGIRVQSFFFAAHLASHGYIVVTPDHHGNTFVDTLVGIDDPISAINRPLDMSFLIDSFLAFNADPDSFFSDSIDADAIGMSGHSFGGYTTFALAGGAFSLGTFTDTRIKAIFPQAPGASQFDDDFFSTITIPTLIVGGSIDETTPFASSQQRPFDELLAGATIVGLAELIDGGHFTFSDFCEVPRELLGFLGGFDEACEPRHLPWRHAHDIVNFLSLNFFDATLKDDAEALARLDPTNLAQIEDLIYQSK
jgi:predicted dienelactone hydrolase